MNVFSFPETKRLREFLELFQHAFAFDLGTDSIRVMQGKKKVVIDQPHLVAINTSRRSVLAYGQEAQEMAGKVGKEITVLAPFEHSVMSYFSLSVSLYRKLFEQLLGKMYSIKPVVMATVPIDATPVERGALMEAFFAAGARKVFFIASPLAASIGAGVPVAQTNGNIIVQFGAGIVEVAVISLGTIVHSKSIRLGSALFDEAMTQVLKQKHQIQVPVEIIQQIKHQVLDLCAVQGKRVQVTGKDLITGRPKTVEIPTSDFIPSLEHGLTKITTLIQEFLEEVPAALISDAVDKGILLSGGGALLKGYAYCLSQVIGVPVSLAEQPQLCAVKGAQIALDYLDFYRQSVTFQEQW